MFIIHIHPTIYQCYCYGILSYNHIIDIFLYTNLNNMKALLKSFNINEKFTKPRLEKQPVYNHIKNNISRIEDYNFMTDLIEMPETRNGNKYILVIVDLAANEFDIEPLKFKSSEEV